MCGVFGIISGTGEMPDEGRLQRTAKLLEHRGPDDSGIFVDVDVGLVHTRLSLLDLNPRSAQPFWDDGGRYALVYNGEVYNYKELRVALESNGVALHTTSDTEVVLQMLIREGVEAAMSRLEGMFAFALWDRERSELTLARDRFGIKPMFYHWDGNRLLFGSEIQAFDPWLTFTPDPWSIAAFLYGFAGPTDGHTFFSGVEFLPPGSVLTTSPGKPPVIRRLLSIDRLWDEELHRELSGRTDHEVLAILERGLMESVQQQLFADAKVGALCSGGLDSSLIMAMAARSHDDLAVFHADVVGPHSESTAAQALARHLHLDLEKVEVVDDDFLTLLPELVLHNGNPFLSTPHSVPMYKVSELIRSNGVKAVLSGEGADEGFLGYAQLLGRAASKRHVVPASLASRFVGPRKRKRGWRDVLRARKRSPVQHPVDLVTGLLTGFEIDLESERNRQSIAAVEDREVRTTVTTSLDLYNHNLRALLHRNDTMGMAASVECRFPFLDSEFVRLAVNAPPRFKVRKGLNRDPRHRLHIDKWALREIAKSYIPPELYLRTKKGFTSNAYSRLQVSPDLFFDSYVSDLLRLGQEDVEYLLGQADRRLTAKLVHLEAWGQMFIVGADADGIAARLHENVAVRPDRSRADR